jgi:hypothetical protein
MFFHRSAWLLLRLSLRLATCAAVAFAGLTLGRAESSPTPRPAPFSSALSPAEFSGAGLSKLTDAELQELNRLVRAHESGELVRAREAARRAEEEAARAVRDATAERRIAETATTPPAPARKESLLERIRLKPGTQIDYDTLESELVGEFAGWREGTVFTLANGQRWRVLQGEYESPRDTTPRRVWIKPGLLGTFFIEFEGIKGRAKVAFAGSSSAGKAPR